jgi:hypothetical protein
MEHAFGIAVDMGMTNFYVAAPMSAFPPESISAMRWWFIDHDHQSLTRLKPGRKMVVMGASWTAGKVVVIGAFVPLPEVKPSQRVLQKSGGMRNES